MESSGVKEIDDVHKPLICVIGNSMALRRVVPSLSQEWRASGSVAELKSKLQHAQVGYGNLQSLRHSKTFVIEHVVPTTCNLKTIFDQLNAQLPDVAICVGLVNVPDADADAGRVVMTMIRKDNSRGLKSGCFDVEGCQPSAIYNFTNMHRVQVNAVIMNYCAILKQTYSGFVISPLASEYSFERVAHATKSLSAEQLIMLKGTCSATPPKKRSEFEAMFLRVAASLSVLTRRTDCF